MIKNIEEARKTLKIAKQNIKNKYEWTTKDYRANVYKTEKGLKLIIQLLKLQKGFKKVYEELKNNVNVKFIHSDTVTKTSNIVESLIRSEFEKGITEGNINGIQWNIGTTGYRPVINATINFVNKLEEL